MLVKQDGAYCPPQSSITNELNEVFSLEPISNLILALLFYTITYLD